MKTHRIEDACRCLNIAHFLVGIGCLSPVSQSFVPAGEAAPCQPAFVEEVGSGHKVTGGLKRERRVVVFERFGEGGAVKSLVSGEHQIAGGLGRVGTGAGLVEVVGHVRRVSLRAPAIHLLHRLRDAEVQTLTARQ